MCNDFDEQNNILQHMEREQHSLKETWGLTDDDVLAAVAYIHNATLLINNNSQVMFEPMDRVAELLANEGLIKHMWLIDDKNGRLVDGFGNVVFSMS